MAQAANTLHSATPGVAGAPPRGNEPRRGGAIRLALLATIVSLIAGVAAFATAQHALRTTQIQQLIIAREMRKTHAEGR